MLDKLIDPVTSKSAYDMVMDALDWILPGFVVKGIKALFEDKYGNDVPDFMKPATDKIADLANSAVSSISGEVARQAADAAPKGVSEAPEGGAATPGAKAKSSKGKAA